MLKVFILKLLVLRLFLHTSILSWHFKECGKERLPLIFGEILHLTEKFFYMVILSSVVTTYQLYPEQIETFKSLISSSLEVFKFVNPPLKHVKRNCSHLKGVNFKLESGGLGLLCRNLNVLMTEVRKMFWQYRFSLDLISSLTWNVLMSLFSCFPFIENWIQCFCLDIKSNSAILQKSVMFKGTQFLKILSAPWRQR